jgi:hypothetical protein
VKNTLRVGLAVGLFLLGAEGVIRLVRPSPPIQVVGGRTPLGDIDGVPVWRVDVPRANEGCPARRPDARVAVFSGDSIFFGIEVDGGDVLTSVAQEVLDREAGEGAWCVLNLSQAGFSFDQKRAWLRRALASHSVDRVYWEVWPNDAARYVRIGDRIYNVAGAAPDDPSPLNRLGLPEGLDRTLMRSSRLYEYLMMVLLPKPILDPAWVRDVYATRLRALRDEVVRAGGAFTLVLPPLLDQPFAPRESLEGHRGLFLGLLDAFAPEAILLDEVFLAMGIDHREVRLDPCCHYDFEGHRVLGVLFADRLLERCTMAPVRQGRLWPGNR